MSRGEPRDIGRLLGRRREDLGTQRLWGWEGDMWKGVRSQERKKEGHLQSHTRRKAPQKDRQRHWDWQAQKSTTAQGERDSYLQTHRDRQRKGEKMTTAFGGRWTHTETDTARRYHPRTINS